METESSEELTNFLKMLIKKNQSSLQQIKECSGYYEAKPLLRALYDRDKGDALEGFLRAGLHKSLPWGNAPMGSWIVWIL